MSYIVTRRNRIQTLYLGFDDYGLHNWTENRLDAIRFESTKQVAETCSIFLNTGAEIQPCDVDGHYEFYCDYEIQIFKHLESSLWTYRYRPIVHGYNFTYHNGNHYTSHLLALMAVKSQVDNCGKLATFRVVRP